MPPGGMPPPGGRPPNAGPGGAPAGTGTLFGNPLK
jgi:hypothetical protein